jgi:hypothetical protein
LPLDGLSSRKRGTGQKKQRNQLSYRTTNHVYLLFRCSNSISSEIVVRPAPQPDVDGDEANAGDQETADRPGRPSAAKLPIATDGRQGSTNRFPMTHITTATPAHAM